MALVAGAWKLAMFAGSKIVATQLVGRVVSTITAVKGVGTATGAAMASAGAAGKAAASLGAAGKAAGSLGAVGKVATGFGAAGKAASIGAAGKAAVGVGAAATATKTVTVVGAGASTAKIVGAFFIPTPLQIVLLIGAIAASVVPRIGRNKQKKALRTVPQKSAALVTKRVQKKKPTTPATSPSPLALVETSRQRMISKRNPRVQLVTSGEVTGISAPSLSPPALLASPGAGSYQMPTALFAALVAVLVAREVVRRKRWPLLQKSKAPSVTSSHKETANGKPLPPVVSPFQVANDSPVASAAPETPTRGSSESPRGDGGSNEGNSGAGERKDHNKEGENAPPAAASAPALAKKKPPVDGLIDLFSPPPKNETDDEISKKPTTKKNKKSLVFGGGGKSTSTAGPADDPQAEAEPKTYPEGVRPRYGGVLVEPDFEHVRHRPFSSPVRHPSMSSLGSFSTTVDSATTSRSNSPGGFLPAVGAPTPSSSPASASTASAGGASADAAADAGVKPSAVVTASRTSSSSSSVSGPAPAAPAWKQRLLDLKAGKKQQARAATSVVTAPSGDTGPTPQRPLKTGASASAASRPLPESPPSPPALTRLALPGHEQLMMLQTQFSTTPEEANSTFDASSSSSSSSAVSPTSANPPGLDARAAPTPRGPSALEGEESKAPALEAIRPVAQEYVNAAKEGKWTAAAVP